jgi:hypothetical protein
MIMHWRVLAGATILALLIVPAIGGRYTTAMEWAARFAATWFTAALFVVAIRLVAKFLFWNRRGKQ